jgi:peptidoglycan/xylan/chitin deacetylase (PgdA/CDA1 family)
MLKIVDKVLKYMIPDSTWHLDDPNGVYLTFDDGPTPGVTEWILSTLEKYDAKATFFVLGKNAELYPDLYQKILDAGHKIGNHTYSHQKGWGMSLERYLEDVDCADDIIKSELFRPPYARVTPSQMLALAKRYKIVMWSIVSHDYNRRLSPNRVLHNVIDHIEPGAIVVFHDSDKAFRNMSHALKSTLEFVRDKGWKCKIIEL